MEKELQVKFGRVKASKSIFARAIHDATTSIRNELTIPKCGDMLVSSAAYHVEPHCDEALKNNIYESERRAKETEDTTILKSNVGLGKGESSPYFRSRSVKPTCHRSISECLDRVSSHKNSSSRASPYARKAINSLRYVTKKTENEATESSFLTEVGSQDFSPTTFTSSSQNEQDIMKSIFYKLPQQANGASNSDSDDHSFKIGNNSGCFFSENEIDSGEMDASIEIAGNLTSLTSAMDSLFSTAPNANLDATKTKYFAANQPQSLPFHFLSSSSTQSISHLPTNITQSTSMLTEHTATLCDTEQQALLRFTEKFGHFHSKFIDSHCHLDLLLWDRLRWKSSFREFSENVVPNTIPKNFGGCVAVFAHPYNYEKPSQFEKVVSMLEEQHVRGALGCHPKCAAKGAFTEKLLATIRKLNSSTATQRVVAIGECGLDYSQPIFAKESEKQKIAFVEQIKLAIDLQLPLVVHCRDAEEDCLKVMQEHLPHDHPVHRHCFTGNLEQMKRLLTAFPNIYFGFTPGCMCGARMNEVIKEVPVDKILLETDAPYFLPSVAKNLSEVNNCSHPGLAVVVGKHISSTKGLRPEKFLQQCFKNTMRLYGSDFDNRSLLYEY